MKQTILLFEIFIFAGCYSHRSENKTISDVPTEPVIILTQEQFMVVYKNGYTKGWFGARILPRKKLEIQWPVDSVVAIERIFKLLKQ